MLIRSKSPGGRNTSSSFVLNEAAVADSLHAEKSYSAAIIQGDPKKRTHKYLNKNFNLNYSSFFQVVVVDLVHGILQQ